MFEDIFKKSKKEKLRDRLIENKRQGLTAENSYRTKAFTEGKKLIRTGKGHDFVAQQVDVFGKTFGKKTFIEVKSGKAKQSKLQKETQAKNKDNYQVERIDY